MLSACVSDVLMTLRNTEQANQYGSRHSVCALASFLALLHPSLPTREVRGKKEAVINRPPNVSCVSKDGIADFRTFATIVIAVQS